MRRFLKFTGLALLAVLILVVLLFLGAGWKFRRALPQLDGAISIPGLHAPVTVERDALGVPHIRAQSLDDLLVAQGYVVAQDRLWQMDLLRRAAAGDLAEIFGAAAVPHDIQSRTIGFSRAADSALAAMAPGHRAILEAYARGVNAYIAQHSDRLPPEFLALRYQPRPWTPRDTLLIAANLYRELTGFWEDQILRARVSRKVGPDLANDLYAATADSPWDHPLVGLAPATAPQRNSASSPRSLAIPSAPLPFAPPAPSDPRTDALLDFQPRLRTIGGSNNFVLSGTRTLSGHALLENDTHLGWSAPSVWYLIHLTAPGWNVKGFALPGAPLIVIGHNDRIAWGFTNNFANVLTVYAESFSPQNPLEYRVHGQWQRASVRREVIHVRGASDRAVDVVLTRHGPVIQRDGSTGYALRWTATDPGGLDVNYYLLGAADNWDEFRSVLRASPGPAQNAVYADVDGHIGYFVSALVPIQRAPAGDLPVPGDTDDYEWTGFIPRDDLPQLFDPPEGVIATANARVSGPSYKWHLTDMWMDPGRVDRIYQLLGDRKDLKPEDCINISTDIYSYLHFLLAQHLAKAAHSVKPSDPRTAELLNSAASWNGLAVTDTSTMTFLEFTRRALLLNLLQPHLGAGVVDYLAWMRSGIFLEWVLRTRPPRWLPPSFHDYDDLLIRSADLAARHIAESAGPDVSARWQWGRFNQLRLFHPLGRSGLLRDVLSVGPVPISGSIYSVKQITPTFGPSMRFVADLSNFDDSLMNLTLGQSGQFLSPNYKDQFDAWYRGYGIPSYFSDSAERPHVVHHLELTPAPRP
ncbi:MAG TPA: penicillin acylase family protein [Candidatus Acidoferrales bacterium]|nr:penicillin acylase family protein [Candidatus Acidoferrales bacterium]